MDGYRKEAPEPPDPDVTISGVRYRMLCRAQLLVDALNDGTINYLSYNGNRHPWKSYDVWVHQDGYYTEGVGSTFQEAAEDGLELRPVEEERDPPSKKKRSPMGLWVVSGVGAFEFLQWLF